MRLLSLVHDLVGKAPSVEVGYEAADLVALELEYAHAIVGNPIPVRGASGRPLERRPVLSGDDVAEGVSSRVATSALVPSGTFGRGVVVSGPSRITSRSRICESKTPESTTVPIHVGL